MTSLANLIQFKNIQCSAILKETIIQEVIDAYSEVIFTKGSVIRSKLANLIDDVNNGSLKLNPNSTKNILTRYFKVDEFDKRSKTKEDLEKILKSCIVLILYYQEDPDITAACKYDSADRLLEDYPSDDYPSFLDNFGKDEEQYLLKYRNIMMIAFIVIPANSNKNLLVKIAGRLEGSNKGEYVTGGGQKKSVTRRTDIYYKEGHIQKPTKIPKNTTISSSKGSGKRKLSALVPEVSLEDLESLLAKDPALITLPDQAIAVMSCASQCQSSYPSSLTLSQPSPSQSPTNSDHDYGRGHEHHVISCFCDFNDYDTIHDDSIRVLVDQDIEREEKEKEDLVLIMNSIDHILVDLPSDHDLEPSLPLSQSTHNNNYNNNYNKNHNNNNYIRPSVLERNFSISSHHIIPVLTRLTSFTSLNSKVWNSPRTKDHLFDYQTDDDLSDTGTVADPQFEDSDTDI